MTAPLGSDRHPEPIERLLTEALQARADAVTPQRLGPARPPSAAAGRHRLLQVSRVAVALVGLAAAVVVAVLLLLSGGGASAPAPTPSPADQPPITSSPSPWVPGWGAHNSEHATQIPLHPDATVVP